MSQLTCPYCEKAVKPDDEQREEDTIYEKECEHCEKSFTYSIWYDPIYSSEQAPCLNGEDHNFQPIKGFPKEYYAGKVRCSFCGEERETMTHLSQMEPK